MTVHHFEKPILPNMRDSGTPQTANTVSDIASIMGQ